MAKKKHFELYEELSYEEFEENQQEFIKLYENLRKNKALKFYGIKDSVLYWKGVSEEAEILLTYSHHNINELEFKVKEDQYFPKWEDLEESGYSWMRLTNLESKTFISFDLR